MESLGFYHYFEHSKILEAYERSLVGTVNGVGNGADTAIKRVNGFLRVLTNQNAKLVDKSKLVVEALLDVQTLTKVCQIMDEIPALEGGASRTYCTQLYKFAEFLEDSTYWFKEIGLPPMSKSQFALLAIVKKHIEKWRKFFQSKRQKAGNLRNYNVAVDAPPQMNLRLAQQAFESQKFTCQLPCSLE